MMHGGPMQQTEKLLSLAKRQFNRREYHLAEDLVNFVLKEDDKNLDARLLLAQTLERAGRRNLAIQELAIIARLCRVSGRTCPEADTLLQEIDHQNAQIAQDGNGKRRLAQEYQHVEAREGDPLNAIRATRGISPYFGFPEKVSGGHVNNYGFAVGKGKKRRPKANSLSPFSAARWRPDFARTKRRLSRQASPGTRIYGAARRWC